MPPIKDEAFYEAQAAEAALQLAALRRPKLEAALASLDAMAAGVPELLAHRDALGSGEARQALSSVISLLTSAPGIVRHEIASLPKAPEA